MKDKADSQQPEKQQERTATEQASSEVAAEVKTPTSKYKHIQLQQAWKPVLVAVSIFLLCAVSFGLGVSYQQAKTKDQARDFLQNREDWMGPRDMRRMRGGYDWNSF